MLTFIWNEQRFYPIYFPASSYLVFFVFVYNFIRKITMIAWKWCNPYTIKAQVNMFWNQLGTETERKMQTVKKAL